MESGSGHLLLRIFIGEDDRYEGRPLFEAIVETLRSHDLGGATVLKGIEGFGKSSRLHTSSVLRLSEDLPLVVECVDRAERIERILPVLDGMIGDGMITTEAINVRTYRAGGRPSETGERG